MMTKKRKCKGFGLFLLHIFCLQISVCNGKIVQASIFSVLFKRVLSEGWFIPTKDHIILPFGHSCAYILIFCAFSSMAMKGKKSLDDLSLCGQIWKWQIQLPSPAQIINSQIKQKFYQIFLGIIFFIQFLLIFCPNCNQTS